MISFGLRSCNSPAGWQSLYTTKWQIWWHYHSPTTNPNRWLRTGRAVLGAPWNRALLLCKGTAPHDACDRHTYLKMSNKSLREISKHLRGCTNVHLVSIACPSPEHVNHKVMNTPLRSDSGCPYPKTVTGESASQYASQLFLRESSS